MFPTAEIIETDDSYATFFSSSLPTQFTILDHELFSNWSPELSVSNGWMWYDSRIVSRTLWRFKKQSRKQNKAKSSRVEGLRLEDVDTHTWVSLLLVRPHFHTEKKLIFRWRSSDWFICRSTSARHWCWTRSRFRNCWYFWYDRFPGWCGWCSHDHDHGSLDGRKHRWKGNGETYKRSPDIRIQTYS